MLAFALASEAFEQFATITTVYDVANLELRDDSKPIHCCLFS